jgi:hypothetical protein
MDTRAFRKTFTVMLPVCQQEVKVRKPDLLKLALRAKNGQMPSAMRQQVFDGLNGKITSVEQVKEAIKRGDFELNESNAESYLAYVDMLVTDMLIEPRIAVNPDYDNGEISIDDLDTADKQYLANWSQSPEEVQALQDLLSFRDEQSGNVELASDVQDLQPATIGSNGNHG